jgi:hypothetical protein
MKDTLDITATGQFAPRLSYVGKAIVSASVAFVLGVNSGCVCSNEASASEASSPFVQTLSSEDGRDADAIAVKFGSMIYSVPLRYLTGVTQPSGDQKYAAFSIQVLLPDFEPKTSQNSSEFESLGWGNKLRALFEYGRHPRQPAELLADYLKHAGLSPEDYRLIGSGYRFYKSEKTVPHEMFSKSTQNGLLFFICGGVSSVPSPSCTVNEPFSEDVGVIYHFSRKYMDSAADIDGRLHQLIDTFIMK